MGSDESSIQQNTEKSTLPLISGQILISVHGSSGSGKTTLINQLVKKQFNPEYYPTKQMESRQILWNSKIKPNETIRIIVWDVVENTTTSPRPVDTFSRADGIVLIYNPDDPYSVEYALSILYKLPSNGASEHSKIPVLILSNFLDLRGNRLKIHPRLSNFPYPQIQSSLKTGIGLEVCEKWIDRALLYNKQRSLDARLQSVRKEREELMSAICSTIDENENNLYMKRKPNLPKKKKATSKRTPIPYVIHTPQMPPLSELLIQKENNEKNNDSEEPNNDENKKEDINQNDSNFINHVNDSAQCENKNCMNDNENSSYNTSSNDDNINNIQNDINIIDNKNVNHEDNKDNDINQKNKDDSTNEYNNKNDKNIDDDNKNIDDVENTKDNS